MKPKVTVGMRLFSLNIGNAARRSPQVLTPVVVSKVGRKYFTVKTDDKYGFETEYRLDDWGENTGGYCANSKLYTSEQELADESESHNLCSKIADVFKYGNNTKNLNLETLRLIVGAIDSNTNTK